jgi:hypothetical protein
MAAEGRTDSRQSAKVARQCTRQIPNFIHSGRELGSAECHGRAAVMIALISSRSLRETGIFRNLAGDFLPFRPADSETRSSETKAST